MLLHSFACGKHFVLVSRTGVAKLKEKQSRKRFAFCAVPGGINVSFLCSPHVLLCLSPPLSVQLWYPLPFTLLAALWHMGKSKPGKDSVNCMTNLVYMYLLCAFTAEARSAFSWYLFIETKAHCMLKLKKRWSTFLLSFLLHCFPQKTKAAPL